MNTFAALLGILLIVTLFLLLSEDKKRALNPKLLLAGLLTQVFFVLLVKFFPPTTILFGAMGSVVRQLEASTLHATQFLFGFLAGGNAPYEIVNPQNDFIVVFRVLPLIIFVSALSAFFFHIGLLPLVVRTVAKVVSKLFNTSGALAFGVAGCLFFGTIEAPLLIRDYLAKLKRAELFALINTSMATIAGTVMVLYASVLEKQVPGAAGHLFGASLMSLPAALMLSFIWIPQKEKDASLKGESAKGQGAVEFGKTPSPYDNAAEALMKGAYEGLQMVLQIIAVLLVLFASVHLIDTLLGSIHQGWTLSAGLGWLLQPVAWLLGIPWAEASEAGRLLGTKVVLNEFVAYMQLGSEPSLAVLSSRSQLILTYALCGFANLGSLGIIVGGLSSIMPNRKSEIFSLTWRSLLVGNAATFMTGALVSLVF